MGHGTIKRELLIAKVEAIYGTDAAPTGADAILVESVSYTADRLRMVRRPSIHASLGEFQQIYGGSLGGLTFTCEVKGSGAAGTAPEVGPFLRACGLKETIAAGASVSYQPTSTDIESCTIHYYEAAAGGASQVRHILLGCRGNVEFTWQAGDLLRANFTFVGRRSNPSDEVVPAPTFDLTTPVAIRAMATTVGGVAGLIIQRYALNLNNQIEVPDSVNDADGYGEISLNGRDPALDLGRHNELVATIAPWADMTSDTTRAFATGTLGATAGNRVALTAGQIAYRNIQPGEDAGFRTASYPFGLAESAAGNDEFVLSFT